MSLLLVLSPNMKTSSMKTTQLLMNIGNQFDTLLLNFPIEMEKELLELTSKTITPDDFIYEAQKKRIIPEPIGAWEYSARPILEFLPKLMETHPKISSLCYSNSEHEFATVNTALEIAKLTLRTTLRGQVEVGEWRDALLQSLEINRETKKYETESILKKAGMNSICVSDMGGRNLMNGLKKSGIDVKIHYVERLYHFTPLRILERLMTRGFVTDKMLERLVRAHLEYIRSFIYKFDNRDRAYYEWVYSKVPWLREKIDKREIEALDRIIH
jgi:hypothetical protein